jgi:hypothetical protein
MRARGWIVGVVMALLPAVAAAQDAVVVDEAPHLPTTREIAYDSNSYYWPGGRWWVNMSAEFGWMSPKPWPNTVQLRPLDVVGQRLPSNIVLPRNPSPNSLQMGLGFNGGMWFSEAQRFGVDLGLLLYPGPTRSINGYTTGTLVYFPNGTDQSAPVMVRFPEQFAKVAVPVPATATDFFTTVDVNFRGGGRVTESLRLDVLFGYRFAYLDDELFLGTQNTSGTYTDQYGNQSSYAAYKQNRMIVENYFNGGQVGVEAGFNSPAFTVTAAAKIAYGGLTSRTGQSGAFLYPNMPVRTETETRAAYMPSFNGRFGVRLTDGVTAFVGYNFVYLDHVTRFGDVFTSGPITTSPFWVQSVSLGFDLRF